jgi:hypothetical protein
MTELLKRFSDCDRYFIDGLTNQMCGYYSNDKLDCEPENLPIQTLISIMGFYVELCEQNIFFRQIIEARWDYITNKDGIYQDLYDDIFNENKIFFFDLSQQYSLPL